MDLLGDCLPIGLDAQVTVKGLVAFFLFSNCYVCKELSKNDLGV